MLPEVQDGSEPTPPRPTVIATQSLGDGVLGLSLHDQRSVSAFVRGDHAAIAELVEDTRKMAEALAGEGGDSARLRLLARATAAARTQQRVLEVLLGERLAERDEAGVAMVSKALDGVTHRLALFLKHLTMESTLRRRPTVIIRRSDTVSICDG